MKKYYIFGDSSGYWDPIQNSLMEIGVNLKDFIIPQDVVIVHVGDLIHKGPDSDKILAYVSLLMYHNNDRDDRGEWIQLIGNHESNYIPHFPSFWKFDINQQSAEMINFWHQSGQMKIAYALPLTSKASRPIVVSHAGISHDFFQDEGFDMSNMSLNQATEFVNKLNARFIKYPSAFNKAGRMLGYPGATRISPFWIETTNELLKVGSQNPALDQIVGHTSPYMWSWNRWYPSVPNDFVKGKYFSVNEENRLAIFHYYESAAKVFFVDPDFNENPASVTLNQPYLIINEDGEIESSLTKWRGHSQWIKKKKFKALNKLS